MEESEDNMSAEDVLSVGSPHTIKTKPKKRSLVERELETNLTARVTSPVTCGDGVSTSRYGRARRVKNELENTDKKVVVDMKSPLSEKSPIKTPSPVYKMHASNSPLRSEPAKIMPAETYLNDQIESIYQENKSLSRFGVQEATSPSPAKKFPKVYIRKDLIQKRDAEETVMLIKNIFSPEKSSKKTNSHLKNILERSSEKYNLGMSRKIQNGYLDNSSVVKTLDFDSKKKKKENKDCKSVLSKSELFDLEAKCAYQVGDLVWARMGTYPFWPCIVTRDPTHGVFVKKKLFGRIERDVIHVTFFGDNGRRGWIVDTMLRKYLGQLEFESTRENFTPEDKKKDPRLYAAYFVSEKKQGLWNMSVEEAEMLLREPKRLRIDIFNDILKKSREARMRPNKSGKISRTDSDVSLSESLYDSLFSEDDGKVDNADRARNRSRNKSFDVFDVVTACLDNMAAKTGMTKIQRQSHMDRWLQKAKSKTPEKKQAPTQKVEMEIKVSSKKKKKTPSKSVRVHNVYSLRRSAQESQHLLPFQNEHDYSKNTHDVTDDSEDTDFQNSVDPGSGIGIIAKVESLSNKSEDQKTEETTAVDKITVDTEHSKDLMDTKGHCDSKINNYNVDGSNKEINIVISENETNITEDLMDTKGHCDSKINNYNVDGSNKEINIVISENETNITEDLATQNLQPCDISMDNQNSLFIDKNKAVDNIKEANVDRADKPLQTLHGEGHNEENMNSCINHIETTAQLTVENISNDQLMQGNLPNVETSKNEIDKNESTAIATNMSYYEDSDSDEQLPYSPLSVDLNKENSNLEELNNQIAEDQNLDGFDEPNVTALSSDSVKQNIESVENVLCNLDRNENNLDSYNEKQPKDNGIEEKELISEPKPSPMGNKETVTLETVKSAEILDQLNSKTRTEDRQHNIEQVAELKDIGLGKETKPYDVALANGLSGSNQPTTIIPNCETSEDIGTQINKINSNIETEMVQSTTKSNFNLENGNITEDSITNGFHDTENFVKNNLDVDAVSINSEDSAAYSKSENRRKLRSNNKNPLKDPEFVKYLELRQDAIMDENPEISQDEIVAYLHKTYLYEENLKSDTKKNDDVQQSNMVKGLHKDQSDRKKKLSLNRQKNNIAKRKKLTKDKISTESLEVQENTTATKQIISSVDIVTNKESTVLVPEPESVGPNSESSDIKFLKDNNLDTISISSCDSNTEEVNKDSKNNKRAISFVSAELDIEKHIEPFKQAAVKNEASDKTAKDSVQFDANTKYIPPTNQSEVERDILNKDTINNKDYDADSIDSEDSEAPLIKCKLRSMKSSSKDKETCRNVKYEVDADVISINSEDSEISVGKRPKKKTEKSIKDPEFIKYLELRQDALIDENPQLTQDEIVAYLYQTWLYEENSKSDLKKTEEIQQSNLVKGLNDNIQQPKKIKRKTKTENETVEDDVSPKDKPKRKTIKPLYNEEYWDIEDEIEYFEIFNKHKQIAPKVVTDKISESDNKEDNVALSEIQQNLMEEVYDEVELYFEDLTRPKPNIFKGLVREKVCEICETTGNLVKCKGCNGTFHPECAKKDPVIVEVQAPARGRKKKKKVGRKPKSRDDSETHEDGSEDLNASIEELIEMESRTVDANVLEAELSAKMKEIIDSSQNEYDYYSGDDGLDWSDTVPGKCEIIDIKLKPKNEIDYSDFKCNNCQKYDTPICFVCKSASSKSDSLIRQKCHVAHCYKFYHLECLDHWPQTHFNGGEPSKTNKKINEYFEALTCPRHVCHTCVSDDPRGCKTRFSGDKLARCVRCPATYHSFTKCLPAGTQILTASHIICPRHYQHRPGKIPCHVNTGWCFICALGGSLICCEYCPTSFHAECLNIKPPEGGYMCEDCETGRLPLYGEMVWVKLGHYRWWPGIILHPAEIPENIMAVKHSPGEFVVRFFGQYDHYWVNRGRVFPFQEGDSGRISSQKSKIDAAFTMAMEHAQRACEILKTAQPNEEESLDIASSLLPPHYVKLKVNKPCGSLCGRRLEDPESSLTQCECNPLDEDPCGPYSQCLNRMLLTECGPTCRAGDRCNNRAFEKRLYPKLVPYRTPSRGWGLKTLEDIKAGQFVIEYVGELIDEEEFRRRMRRKHEIRDENFYFLTLDKERMIDAGPKGNLARFMNHCCEPNCETQKWTVLGDVRVGLFALYDIPANSEVTFNYNLECAGIDKKRCMCGAKRCSGYIGAKPKQDDPQSKKNKLHTKRTYKKRKNIEESPSTNKNKPKRPIGRPPKPKELTEIEKDVLIIKNATSAVSSDDSSRSLSVSSECDRSAKPLKRKRVSFSMDEVVLCNGTESPSAKKHKPNVENPVGD